MKFTVTKDEILSNLHQPGDSMILKGTPVKKESPICPIKNCTNTRKSNGSNGGHKSRCQKHLKPKPSEEKCACCGCKPCSKNKPQSKITKLDLQKSVRKDPIVYAYENREKINEIIEHLTHPK